MEKILGLFFFLDDSLAIIKQSHTPHTITRICYVSLLTCPAIERGRHGTVTRAERITCPDPVKVVPLGVVAGHSLARRVHNALIQGLPGCIGDTQIFLLDHIPEAASKSAFNSSSIQNTIQRLFPTTSLLFPISLVLATSYSGDRINS